MKNESKKMNLYEVGENIERLFDQAIDAETGEIVDGEALQELERLEQKRENILLGCASLIKNKKAWLDSLKAHKTAIDKRIRALDNAIGSIKSYMRHNLTEGEKFKSEFHTVYTMHTESVQLKVEPEALPMKYRNEKLTVTANKTAIKGDLEAGAGIDHIAEMRKGFSVVVR